MKLRFGKYSEMTWQEVLNKDPEYIEWVSKNTNRFIPPDVLALCKAINVGLVRDESIQLNEKQTLIVNNIINNITRVTIVLGQAGTGKSQILRALKKSTKVIRLAPTGIAALGIDGTTFHSQFRIDPHDLLVTVNKSVNKTAVAIVLDECFYTSATLLYRALDSVLLHAPGANFVFLGDPYQLLPISNQKIDKRKLLEYDEEEQTAITELKEWKGKNLFDVLEHFKLSYTTYELTQSMRHGDNTTFKFMEAARRGALTPEQLTFINKQVRKPGKEDFILTHSNKERIEYTEKYLKTFSADARFEIKKLPYNIINLDTEYSVDDEPLDGNTLSKQEKINRDKRGALRLTRVQIEQRLKRYLESEPKLEHLKNSLRRTYFNFTPERLAIGAMVMITRNDKQRGVVNGDLGIIKSKNDDFITVTLKRTEEDVTLPRYFHGYRSRQCDADGTPLVHIGLTMFFIKLANAATVHKVQGITLDGSVHIRLSSEMKEVPGLLYTALTRVRSIDQISLSGRLTNSYLKYARKWDKILKLKLNEEQTATNEKQLPNNASRDLQKGSEGLLQSKGKDVARGVNKA